MTRDTALEELLRETDCMARKASDTKLVLMAEHLYINRHDAIFRTMLLSLKPHLQDLAAGFAVRLRIDMSQDTQTRVSFLDSVQTLAVILTWMSRHVPFKAWVRANLRKQAKELVALGIVARPLEQNGSATTSLLFLTAAQIAVTEKETKLADEHLIQAWGYSRTITDPNQRARVFRKLGMLYRKIGHYGTGLGFGIRALFVPGSTLAVRTKSAAALMGISR